MVLPYPYRPSAPMRSSVLLLLAACGPQANDAGQGGTHEGAAGKAVVTGHTSAEASFVHAWCFDDDGESTLLGEATLDASGVFSVEVPAGTRRLIVGARDASGAVVASAVLATSGEAGGEVATPPLDAETTLEASIYAALVAGGTAPDDVDVVDLRARIDAIVAARAAGDEATIADAVRAAQGARASSYAAAGLSLTADTLLDAEAGAAAAYDASLDAGADPDAAYDAFVSGVASAHAALGVDAVTAWEAEAQAGLAMRLYMAGTSESLLTADAVVRAAGRLEAELAGGAAVEAAASSDDGATAGIAADAAADLKLATSASESGPETAFAWAAFSAALIGPAPEDTVIDGLLAASAKGTLDAALDDALDAAVAFDGEVQTAVSATLEAGGDAEAVADVVTATWATFSTDTRASFAAELGASEEAGDAAELVLVAVGGFRAR